MTVGVIPKDKLKTQTKYNRKIEKKNSCRAVIEMCNFTDLETIACLWFRGTGTRGALSSGFGRDEGVTGEGGGK